MFAPRVNALRKGGVDSFAKWWVDDGENGVGAGHATARGRFFGAGGGAAPITGGQVEATALARRRAERRTALIERGEGND